MAATCGSEGGGVSIIGNGYGGEEVPEEKQVN